MLENGMSKKLLVCIALSLSAMMGLSARAQPYPTRTMKIVVPYAAGGGVDVVARMVAQHLSAELGQSVIVENRPGAGGALGSAYVAKSAPDGYTLLFTANSTHTTAPHLMKEPLYDPIKDFTPIATVLDYSFTLVTNPKLPIKTVSDLVAYARKNPDKVNFASAGVGSGPQLAAELLKSISGAPMVHIPFKGNAPAEAALIAGQVTLLFDTTGTAVNFIKNGQMRALAVTSRTRNAELPDVPTMIEAGIPNFEVVGWYGLMGPAGLPPAITGRLIQAVKVAMKQPAMRKPLQARGFDIEVNTGDAFAKRLKAEYALWGRVVKEAKIEKH
jgi:tripartite-type tricarboxylate transporter receptor subunit TctC